MRAFGGRGTFDERPDLRQRSGTMRNPRCTKARMNTHQRRVRAIPELTPDPNGAGAILPSLVDVFEEDPLVEATALATLAAGLRHDLLPAHAMGRGESLQYLQHIG